VVRVSLMSCEKKLTILMNLAALELHCATPNDLRVRLCYLMMNWETSGRRQPLFIF